MSIQKRDFKSRFVYALNLFSLVHLLVWKYKKASIPAIVNPNAVPKYNTFTSKNNDKPILTKRYFPNTWAMMAIIIGYFTFPAPLQAAL